LLVICTFKRYYRPKNSRPGAVQITNPLVPERDSPPAPRRIRAVRPNIENYRAAVLVVVVVAGLDGVLVVRLWPGAFSELPGPF
jgi:hypothetical protein